MSGASFPGLPAYPVKQRLSVEGVDVVLLAVPPEEHFPQNIYGMSEQGDVLWQIEPRPSETPNNRYTSIRDEVGLVVAVAEDSAQRKIDPKTGRVLNEEKLGQADRDARP